MSAPRQSFLFSSCDSKSIAASDKASRPSAIKNYCENSDGLMSLLGGLERSLNSCVMGSDGDKQNAAKELVNAVIEARDHIYNIQSCVEPKAGVQNNSSSNAPKVKF